MTTSTPNSQSQSANLDFLRAFAVIAVLIAHLCDALRIDAFQYLGQTGVLLFFVHTALVLLRSLSRLHADGEGHVVSRFFVQRAFRIYPLYLAAIAFTLLLRVPWIDTFGAHPRAPWLGWHWIAANLLFVQNVIFVTNVSSPMWSLAYEMQMYLVLPLVYLIAVQKEALTKLVLIAFLAASSAIAMRILLPLPFDGGAHEPITYFVPCFLGGAYAFVRSERKAFLPGFLLFPFLCVCASLFCWQPNLPFVQWLICTIVGCTLPMFAELKSKALAAAVHSIAKYSYGIYLWHWPLLWIWFRWASGISLAARCILFAGSLALLSTLSYHLLEAPLILMGRRISRYSSSRSIPGNLTLPRPGVKSLIQES